MQCPRSPSSRRSTWRSPAPWATTPAVVVLGEDVGAEGGVFRATDGLLQRFGADRVLDTPLAEGAIAGLSVGLAAQGFRPVSEIQFTGFIYPAIDQMANHAARLRTRTRGRLTCPMVLRAPYGGGIRAVEHHSESPEAIFAHIPGLRVVIPSSPARAYGLLLAAIRNPDPVVFFEPTRLYRAAREEVEDDGAALPLDRAFVLREGRRLTLVTWGAMTKETAAAAEMLAEDGISAEILDLATLKPFDTDAVAVFGRQDRPVHDHPRSAADRRHRRRDRRNSGRSRARVAVGPGRAGRRQGYGDAAAAARTSVDAERSRARFRHVRRHFAALVVVPPQVAILGAGRIAPRVVTADGKFAAHHILPLSLTFDHRAVTGGEAARFLKAAIEDLQRPE